MYADMCKYIFLCVLLLVIKQYDSLQKKHTHTKGDSCFPSCSDSRAAEGDRTAAGAEQSVYISYNTFLIRLIFTYLSIKMQQLRNHKVECTAEG